MWIGLYSKHTQNMSRAALNKMHADFIRNPLSLLVNFIITSSKKYQH